MNGAPETRGILRRFFREAFRPYLGLQLEIGVCLIAVVVLELIDPLILRSIIDRALGDGDVGALWLLTGLLGLVFLFRSGFRLVTVWFYSYTGLRVLFDLRRRVFEHALRLSPYFFRGERGGDILARVTADIDMLNQTAAFTVVNAVRDSLTIVGILGILAWLDPLLTLAFVAAYPVLFAALWRINGRMRHEGLAAREAYGGLFTVLEERLTGVRVVQEFRREKDAARRHVAASRPWIRTNINLSMLGAGQAALADLVATFAFIVVFLFGGSRALSGQLSLGSLVAYYTLASRLFRPVSGLIDINVNLQTARGALARIFEFLDQGEAVREVPGARAPVPVRGALRFAGAGVDWPDGTRALDGIELSVAPGQVIAVVGPSGSGKSTLAALATRFLEPARGCVLLDGQDVRQWPLGALRAAVSLVPQEVMLFHDTLAANLRLARPRATEAELRDALSVAGLDEFVAALPAGLETVAGEHGLRLSGGERQRLALARALLKDARLYILDEATSALDPETERRVVGNFLARCAGRTVILIAHRLTSVTGADRIVVIDDGRMVESGTHAELYAQGGVYRRLFDAQQHEVPVEA